MEAKLDIDHGLFSLKLKKNYAIVTPKKCVSICMSKKLKFDDDVDPLKKLQKISLYRCTLSHIHRTTWYSAVRMCVLKHIEKSTYIPSTTL
jgi:hypothetical protein